TLYGRPYPSEDFDRGWKDLLFDDFHDIMPGSGIAVNYLDAKRNLEDVGRTGRAILDGSLGEIAAHIKTTGPGVPVAVFNSLSWPRNEVVEADVQLPGDAATVEVVDAAGKPMPSQMLTMDRGTHRVRLLLKASVPGFGYRTYYVRGAVKPPVGLSEVQASESTLDNDLMRLKVHRQTGSITSVLHNRDT